MWTVATLRAAAAAARRQAVSAGADAGAAVPLQPGLRRLRQDSASGGDPAAAPDARAVLGSGRRMRRADRLDSRRRAAACIRRSTRSSPAWSRARNTSISAPTRSSSKNRCRGFKPSKYLSFSVHLDGPREEHDQAVCREGIYDIAVQAIRAAKRRGFRVTTNTTLFDGADPERMRGFFDDADGARRRRDDDLARLQLRESPGSGAFSRAAANDRAVPPTAATAPSAAGGSISRRCFWNFCKASCDLECTPWGSPTYNIFGWQKPCYLLGEGYCADVSRADGNDRLGRLRPQERQSEVPRLHGPLRLRADRRRRDVWLAARPGPHRPADVDRNRLMRLQICPSLAFQLHCKFKP